MVDGGGAGGDPAASAAGVGHRRGLRGRLRPSWAGRCGRCGVAGGLGEDLIDVLVRVVVGEDRRPKLAAVGA